VEKGSPPKGKALPVGLAPGRLQNMQPSVTCVESYHWSVTLLRDAIGAFACVDNPMGNF